MTSAEHSKALVLLLLLILCLLMRGVNGCSLLCCVLLSFYFCNHLAGKEKNWLLYFNCLLMTFDSLRSVSLPQGAAGWSTVCDCGSS